eukprot:TRINITY_DN8930_c0_g2_i1.p1 TRINITY_DN8930_c0_g2~~TRINITY_DN8930_c0_g2_i1.p1  ORF type:complete len:387 (+),score=52.92 TRINITY_DN8930_c0_g2_i1:96-1256(+)
MSTGSKRHSKLSDYVELETIGTGTFGICKKIQRKSDGQVFVWKELDYGTMSEKEKHMLVSEVNILREFRHPSIVRYHDRIIDRDNTTIYIIMEYCQGGDLAAVIKSRRKSRTPVKEAFIRKVLQQVVAALNVCHQRKDGAVMHRDLKPANIFLDHDGNAKLGDFGLARVMGEHASLATTFVGSPYYMSPELISHQGYNEKSDVWSLGCIIYELASFRPPFEALTQADLAVKIRRGTFARLPAQYSDELDALIRTMLQQDHHLRPSIAELTQHEYLCSSSRTSSRQPSRNMSLSDDCASTSSSCPSCKELQTRSQQLAAREAALEARIRDVEHRERQLLLREKLLTQRQALQEQNSHQRIASKHRLQRYSSNDLYIAPSTRLSPPYA